MLTANNADRRGGSRNNQILPDKTTSRKAFLSHYALLNSIIIVSRRVICYTNQWVIDTNLARAQQTVHRQASSSFPKEVPPSFSDRPCFPLSICSRCSVCWTVAIDRQTRKSVFLRFSFRGGLFILCLYGWKLVRILSNIKLSCHKVRTPNLEAKAKISIKLALIIINFYMKIAVWMSRQFIWIPYTDNAFCLKAFN